MGGQRKHLGRAQCRPFGITGQHAGERDAFCNPAARGQSLPPRPHARTVVGPGHHQMQRGIASGHLRERLDQQIATFLRVQATEEQHDALAAGGRPALEKRLGIDACRGIQNGDAIADHRRPHPIGPERLCRESLFLVGGEEHR